MRMHFSRPMLSLLLLAMSAFAQAGAPTIFAAASLKPALDALAAQGTLGTPAPRRVYAGSSQLARQIEQGAPADLFLSADRQWMDYLAQRHHLVRGQRSDLLGNTLVLVAARDSTLAVALDDHDSVLKALGKGRLAVALTNSVPAGMYAKQALKSLRLWDALETRLAPSRDVRAALALVVHGECPLGIVYGSDAVSEPRVRVVARFPAASHDAIVYPLALLWGHDNDRTRALLAALRSPAALTVFHRYGFAVLADSPP